MKIRNQSRLVFGVGINDADYHTTVYDRSDKNNIKRFVCPFYTKWVYLLQRCYYEKYLMKHPSYRGCSVCDEWIYFSKFKTWMVTQDWEGKVLDKDILFPSNKIYGPDTCVFVDHKVNNFIIERNALRGEHPIGASYSKQKGKFQSQCWSVVTRKHVTLGVFKTAEEAHAAWLAFKLEQAKILAAQQPDQRVADALISRYENYDNIFKETK